MPSCAPAAARALAFSALHAATQLQRLRGVEAAGDPLRCAPRCQRVEPGLARDAAGAASLSATGSIAGARSPRGNSRPTACITASSGVRGAKVKSTDCSARAGEAGQRRGPRRRRRSGSASPWRPRGRSGRAPGRACRRRGSRSRPRRDRCGMRSRARPTSVGDRSIATTSAPRRAASTAKRAGAAAGIEHARGRAGPRAARPAACRASGRGRRGRWRGCGRPARPRSAATTPRPRCGRSRSAARRGGAR